MIPVHELAALGAATCWAITGLIAAGPAGHLGSLAYNRGRQTLVAVLFVLYALVTGAWRDVDTALIAPLMLSGFIGIFLGDTLLFAGLNRIGPRRSGIVFALNAPIAAVLGFVVLGETLSLKAVAGVAITAVGVALAILFGTRGSQSHAWEKVKGPLWIGVAFGLGAATGQAVGSIIARPIMETGIDPILASVFRAGAAALCLSLLMSLPLPAVKARGPLTLKVAAMTALSAIIAVAIGMTLLLFALSGGKVGIVSTLSATSPAIILPMLWLVTGERPAAGAWAGAALVVVGLALIFMR